MYEMYLRLKEKDSSKLYLFKVGVFYIFLEEDALEVIKYTTLKLTNYSKNVVKCGFPKTSLDKYMSIFSNINLNVVIVEDNTLIQIRQNSSLDNYLNEIAQMNIDEMKPIECINVLNKLKELL